jgi:hypothetical protein
MTDQPTGAPPPIPPPTPAAPPTAAGAAPTPAAPAAPRLGRPLWIYAAGLVAVLVVAVVIIKALEPADPPPACPPDVVLCPDPPPGGGGAIATLAPAPPQATLGPEATSSPQATLPPRAPSNPFVAGTVWTSTELGFQVEYDPEIWKVERESANDVVLVPVEDLGYWVLFEGAPASDVTVDAYVDGRLDLIRQSYTSLEVDDDPYSAIVGPHIGYVDAIGTSYVGTGTSADGLPLAPGGLAVLGATDGRIVVCFTMEVTDPDRLAGANTRELRYRGRGDRLLKDFRWGS